MRNGRTISLIPLRQLVPAAVRDHWELAKPEITLHVVLAALAGFMLGAPGIIAPVLLAYTMVGIALCSAGSGALNHYVERDYDGLMRRTARRPLPAGRVSPRAALVFGIVLVTCGLGLLTLVNLLTLGLATLTVALYLFVYTPLKRRTSFNTLVGTLPGALPALGGYTAAAGSLEAGAWIVFAVLALWQMPHFMSLAWMYRKDYARAGFAMQPVLKPDGRATGRHILVWSALMVGVSLLPVMVSLAGWVYLVTILAAGLGFLWPAIGFARTRETRDARRVLQASIAYVPLLVAALALDRWLS